MTRENIREEFTIGGVDLESELLKLEQQYQVLSNPEPVLEPGEFTSETYAEINHLDVRNARRRLNFLMEKGVITYRKATKNKKGIMIWRKQTNP